MGDVLVKRVRLALAVVAALGLGACVNPFENTYENRIAVVDSVAVPETVVVRRRFAVTIYSQGPNLCWKKGPDSIGGTNVDVDITPYDQAYVGSGACAQAIAHFTHVVTLALGARGTGTIDIRHRLRSMAGGDSLATITRTVVVE